MYSSCVRPSLELLDDNKPFFINYVYKIMPRNVEIKAKVRNFQSIIEKAKSICGTEAEILKQHDTFFKTNCGRLKLRKIQGREKSQLIFYNRPDTEGPKLSDYSICEVENPEDLISVLSGSIGVIGQVKKTRYLFIYEQTRIHIDCVDQLGEFMELEVVLENDQSLEDGQKIAEDLMSKLGVNTEDLISGAYLDQLI